MQTVYDVPYPKDKGKKKTGKFFLTCLSTNRRIRLMT